MMMNADVGDEKCFKLAEKLGVKLTSEEKELAGKPLLKVGSIMTQTLKICQYLHMYSPLSNLSLATNFTSTLWI